jgi:phospholipid/cholesterol/gamma-HCH transport system substrate-binding protein
MNDRVMALRVGIVLLAAGFITGFLIILLGEGRTFLQGRYTVHIKFPQAPGVAIDTPVRKDGVLIGRVTHVELRDEGGVVITARIDEGRKVYKDEAVRIATSSLLGDSVLEFVPDPTTSQPHELYQDGDFIGNGRVAADPISVLTNLEGDVRTTLNSFRSTADDVSNLAKRWQNAFGTDSERMQRIMQKSENALDQMNRSAESLNQFIGDPEVTADLKEGIRRLPQTMQDMQTTLATTRETVERFRGTQERFERNLDNIEPFTKALGDRGDEIVGDVHSIVKNVESLTSIGADLAERISNADGSLAKLIRDDDLYDKIYSTVDNFHDMSRRVQPIINDLRIFSDKIATDPRQLGVKGALDRRPVGAGIKGLPNIREPVMPWQEVE